MWLMTHYRTQQSLGCGLPVLGVCYGKQILNKELGVAVKRKYVRDGQFEIQVETELPLFKGLETRQMVLLTHGDSVDKVVEGLRCVAKSSRHIISAIADITESSSMIRLKT
ncbi:putative GMP synthase [Daphnia magna]|nr:putative GMP synthase [Daphnia magna]